jgi:bacteriocin-like protein
MKPEEKKKQEELTDEQLDQTSGGVLQRWRIGR